LVTFQIRATLRKSIRDRVLKSFDATHDGKTS